MDQFSKILIANRGEIACRIIRTAHDMGYATVSVFSEADRTALHTELASEAIYIGPAPANESYLNIDQILAAAAKTGADAIHPGYGFLSENAGFAARCHAAEITFIGPSADAIRLMGNKAEAKRRMIAAKVPCVPGYEEPDQSDDRFIQAAGDIGFPVMVKAAAGGGGRGMRLVEAPEKLEKALSAARSEAENAFGSGELILEKAVIEPRHIEIQIFADNFGNTVHLGERDCSIQRRHQKVIEEAPSPAVSEDLRQRMGAAAVAAAEAIQYSGAGTVEFLLSPDNVFYFLEMNTRLQVEHPVTELITGYDLVEWQIRVARGEKLPARQEDISFNGHAIEARLYAEDPYKNFLPRVGTLLKWQPTEGIGLRTDHGLKDDFEVTPYYDAMVAKVIAYGPTREDARRRLIRALSEMVALGLTTNRQFLIDCLAHENFAKGASTTAFIEQFFPKKILKKPPFSEIHLKLAAMLQFHQNSHRSGSVTDGWNSSQSAASPLLLAIDKDKYLFQIQPVANNKYAVTYADTQSTLEILSEQESDIRIEIDGHHFKCTAIATDTQLYVGIGAAQLAATEITHLAANAGRGDGDGFVLAPMNGKILNISVTEGGRVKRGQTLVTLEAMKMEHEITARIDGTIARIGAKVGDQVASRSLLVEITADMPEAK